MDSHAASMVRAKCIDPSRKERAQDDNAIVLVRFAIVLLSGAGGGQIQAAGGFLAGAFLGVDEIGTAVGIG